MIDRPKTIILVHKRERPSKCSVEHLRTHPGYQFFEFPTDRVEIPNNYVRLAHDGEPITSADSDKGLFIIDGTWRYAERMERVMREANLLAHVPARRVDWLTAYPRKSKYTDEPDNGLATIEAIYAYYYELGLSTHGLLVRYRWREQFLQINASALARGPHTFPTIRDQQHPA